MSAINETSPHRAPSESQDLAVCGVKGGIPWAVCQLPEGHPFPHRHEDEQGVTTWEPVDVSDLRRGRDRLRTELVDLVDAARSFATAAEYTIAASAEEEFGLALDAAEAVAALDGSDR